MAAANKLIICRAHDQTVALEVDQIVTIYKQEKYHATPSLHPRLAARKDTLDRLIEFKGEDNGGDRIVEHVLVVNIYNLVRNHLELGAEKDTAAGEEE
jgi:purine-binding chemotaxis protein CheW